MSGRLGRWVRGTLRDNFVRKFGLVGRHGLTSRPGICSRRGLLSGRGFLGGCGVRCKGGCGRLGWGSG
jgi:hypothetical protein